MKHNNKSTISYDSDADVLSFETSPSGRIDYAEEVGNVVVHFSKQGRPILVEILGASQSFRKNKEFVRTLRSPIFVR